MKEHGFVLADIDNKQVFPSPSQQRELLDIARIGLRKNNISIANETVLKRALGVLGDALTRQLREEGREIPRPNERLRPLIGKGLLLREDLCGEAKDILDLTLKNETVGSVNMGPFALQNSLLIGADNEREHHLLVPNLKIIEQLVVTSKKRKTTIDKIAAVGLTHLPEGLGKITLDRIPNIADRAKLVRNMITSFLFRGSLNPIIGIEDLRNFQTLSKPEYFSDEMKKKIVTTLNLSDKEEVAFVLDLFNQAKEVFSNIQFVSEDNAEGMDKLFRKASKSLLLLHPILEREQINIFPSTVASGVLNLWDDAEVVDGFKIPSRKMLYQAIRQTRANNDNFNTERLYAGMAVLNRHDEIVLAHEAKTRKLKEILSERKTLLENLTSDPAYPLPAEAYGEKYSSEKSVHDEQLIVSRFDKEIRKMTKVMEDNLKIQKEMGKYEEWLKMTYGNILPDFVPMPRSVFLEKLQSEVRRIGASRNTTNNLLMKIEEALSVDLSFSGKDENIFGHLSREGAREWINRELIEDKALAERLKEKPESIPYKNSNQVAFPGRNILNDYEKRLADKNSPAALCSYVRFWKDESTKLKEHSNSKYEIWKKYYKEFTLEAIKQRINLLECSLGVTEKFFSLTTNLEDAKNKLSKFLDNPNEPLPADAVWSKNNASAYILEIKTSELPIMEKIKSDDLREAVLGARKFLHFVSPSIFPLVVSSRSKFNVFMRKGAVEIEKKLVEKKKERESLLGKDSAKTSKMDKGGGISMSNKLRDQVWGANNKIESLSKQLEFYLKAAELAYDPFAPFLKNESFKREDFLRIWKRRIVLASATLNKKKIQGKSKLAKIAFESLLRDVYTRKITQEIKDKQKDLEFLEKEDLKNRLVRKMSNLDLALKDPNQKEESLLKDQNTAEFEGNSR
jgi:hypothetical protein